MALQIIQSSHPISVADVKNCSKPEDLKVLKRSSDIGSQDLYNVKLGQAQHRLIYLNIFGFTIYGHGDHFGQVTIAKWHIYNVLSKEYSR